MRCLNTLGHAQLFSQQRIHPVSEDYDFGFQNIAIGFHAHDFAITLNNVIHANTGDQLRPRLFGLLHQPGVKFTAQNGIRNLRRCGVLAVAIIHRHRPFVGHKGEFFVGDHAFNGGLIRKAGNDAFQAMCIQTPTGDILRASRIAALDNQHLCTFASKHQRRNRTGQTCTHDDGIKDIFGHTYSCQRQDTFASCPKWFIALRQPSAQAGSSAHRQRCQNPHTGRLARFYLC